MESSFMQQLEPEGAPPFLVGLQKLNYWSPSFSDTARKQVEERNDRVTAEVCGKKERACVCVSMREGVTGHPITPERRFPFAPRRSAPRLPPP